MKFDEAVVSLAEGLGEKISVFDPNAAVALIGETVTLPEGINPTKLDELIDSANVMLEFLLPHSCGEEDCRTCDMIGVANISRSLASIYYIRQMTEVHEEIDKAVQNMDEELRRFFSKENGQ